MLALFVGHRVGPKRILRARIMAHTFEREVYSRVPEDVPRLG